MPNEIVVLTLFQGFPVKCPLKSYIPIICWFQLCLKMTHRSLLEHSAVELRDKPRWPQVGQFWLILIRKASSGLHLTDRLKTFASSRMESFKVDAKMRSGQFNAAECSRLAESIGCFGSVHTLVSFSHIGNVDADKAKIT